MTGERTTVYTDGACLGNPGPGGWAWAVPGGRWRNGAEARSTNQRMEISAALDAARTLAGPLEVVSDSTYVVNCFQRDWWRKWVANGWISTSRQPVANKDLWEPLVNLYRAEPGRLQFRWVKGHASDPFNDLVDRLAVAAATSQRGGEGDEPPPASALGAPDAPGVRPSARSPGPTPSPKSSGSSRSSGSSGSSRLAAAGPAALPGLGLGAAAGLRSGTAGDADDLLRLWRLAGSVQGSTDDAPSVRALVAYDPDALVVAEAAGEVIGSVVAGFDGWRGHLHRLAVHPDWRRRGIGLALVAEGERRLAARGARRVGAIVVKEHGSAVAFWAAAGYDAQPQNARYVKNLLRPRP